MRAFLLNGLVAYHIYLFIIENQLGGTLMFNSDVVEQFPSVTAHAVDDCPQGGQIGLDCGELAGLFLLFQIDDKLFDVIIGDICKSFLLADETDEVIDSGDLILNSAFSGWLLPILNHWPYSLSERRQLYWQADGLSTLFVNEDTTYIGG